MSEENLLSWARDLMRDTLVIDAHCDTVLHALQKGYDFTARNDSGHIDIPRLLEAGFDAQIFACFIYRERDQRSEMQKALDMLELLHLAAERSDDFEIAACAADVRRAQQEGRIACVPGIEGGTPVDGDLANLQKLYDRGVRCLTLTWNNSNEMADASDPDQSKFEGHEFRGGLTAFGREAIAEMNRIGMMIDLSHAHESTFWQALELSTKPLLVSHSCCRAINPHYRNVSDEMMRALAAAGGVMGINYFPVFLSADYAKATEKAFNELLARPEELTESCSNGKKVDPDAVEAIFDRLPRLPFSVLIDHIEHAVKVAGADHVALGSDFDGVPALPEGLDDVTDVVRIAAALKERGLDGGDIRKILGANLLRVMAANES